MNKEEMLKAIEDAIKNMEAEPTPEQVAFENGCRYTMNTFQCLLKYCDDLQQRITRAINKIKELYEFGNEWHWDNGAIEDEVREIEEILGGKE